MNTVVLLAGTIVYFAFAYFFYGKFLNRTFGVDKNRICPSKALEDGTDYVPTNSMVLFGHHFASIAGAGPIVGPILAAKYGWLPAMMWILLGCVFVGAMHDFAALFLSVRNDGRSVAYIIEKELGYWGRQIFIIFCLAALVLVVTVFTGQVADSFVNSPEVATASILFILTAPVFGVILKQKLLSLLEGTLIFVPLTFLMIWVGTLLPCDLCDLLNVSPERARVIWMLVLLYYAFIASTIPVWFLLQPRDYLNSFLLYGMMFIGVAGIFAARSEVLLPAVNLEEGAKLIPNVLPLLFVTIACGACSGFHSLVASGTSSKQIANEGDIRLIGYGSMLLEGVLAVVAICAVGYLSTPELQQLFVKTKSAAPIMFAQGVGHFAEALGIPYNIGSTFIALAISAFILTSLDTATRLARFLWQELIMPRTALSDTENSATLKPAPEPGWLAKACSNRWVSTIAIVVLALVMATSGETASIWPVFGSANQLLAAMTLLGVTLFLFRNKKPWLFAMLPMLFMLVIAIWALINLLSNSCGKNWLLFIIGCVLLTMAGMLCILAVRALLKHWKRS